MSKRIVLPHPEYDIDVLKRLIAEAEAPQPVEGQEYSHARATAPYDNRRSMWKFAGGKWYRRDMPTDKWENDNGMIGADEWRNGRLVPYTPPPPTFQVGQWVRPIKESDFDLWSKKILQVVPAPDHAADWKAQNVWTEGGWSYPETLRRATPEEIAAATRIQPRKGLIVRQKAANWPYDATPTTPEVFFVLHSTEHSVSLQSLDHLDARCFVVNSGTMSTEAYEVLDSYTVQGVR